MARNGALTFGVLVIVHGIFVADGQWITEDEGCRTPDGAAGKCVVLQDCQPMVDVFDKVTGPMPPEVAAFLRSYACGFEGRKPKVCCPSKPIHIDVIMERHTIPQPPNVSKHRNLNLLPEDCGHLDTGDRIINGNKTGLFEYPWMALLSYSTGRGPKFECGGTILNNRYILTAAHCIINLKSPMLGVRIGDHDINSAEDCEESDDGVKVCAPPHQDLNIEEIHPHPNYNKEAFTHDIGLLRVTGMDLSKENIRPVCMPLAKTRTYNFTGRNVVVTGWGVTETGRSSTILLQVKIPVIPLEDCKKIYANWTTINHKQLCAGGKTGGDSCAGDSGGPLHVVASLNGDSRLIQQGIVSFGPKICGTGALPGVYTRVAYYMKWILDTIKP